MQLTNDILDIVVRWSSEDKTPLRTLIVERLIQIYTSIALVLESERKREAKLREDARLRREARRKREASQAEKKGDAKEVKDGKNDGDVDMADEEFKYAPIDEDDDDDDEHGEGSRPAASAHQPNEPVAEVNAEPDWAEVDEPMEDDGADQSDPGNMDDDGDGGEDDDDDGDHHMAPHALGAGNNNILLVDDEEEEDEDEEGMMDDEGLLDGPEMEEGWQESDEEDQARLHELDPGLWARGLVGGRGRGGRAHQAAQHDILNAGPRRDRNLFAGYPYDIDSGAYRDDWS